MLTASKRGCQKGGVQGTGSPSGILSNGLTVIARLLRVTSSRRRTMVLRPPIALRLRIGLVWGISSTMF